MLSGSRLFVYTYDQVANLLTSDDSLANLGVSTYQYDAVDRLLRKVTVAGPVYYAYDLSGMKTSVKDPNLDETVNHHDAAGRLARVTTIDLVEADPPEPPIVRENYLHYDDAGLLDRKVLAGNSVVSYHTYDAAGRVSELLNLDDTGAVLTSFVYQRNPNGALTRTAHEDGQFTYYAYDELDRLTEERRVQNPTVYGFSYQYDAASNRTRKQDLVSSDVTSYTLDARSLIQREVTEGDETVYEYDRARRMTLRASPSLATYLSHDERDLPTRLEFASTGFTDDPRDFHYTGTGERAVIVGELGGTAPTFLAYDGTRLLTERMNGGFTWGEYRWAGDTLISSESQESGAFEGPAMDERGSVEKLAGVPGQAIYDRFGVEWANSLQSQTRTRFVTPVFLRLNTTGEQILLNRTSCYLPLAGLLAYSQLSNRASFVHMQPWVGMVAPPPWDGPVFQEQPEEPPCRAGTPRVYVRRGIDISKLNAQTADGQGFTRCLTDHWKRTLHPGPEKAPRVTGKYAQRSNRRSRRPPHWPQWYLGWVIFVEFPIFDPHKRCRHSVHELDHFRAFRAGGRNRMEGNRFREIRLTSYNDTGGPNPFGSNRLWELSGREFESVEEAIDAGILRRAPTPGANVGVTSIRVDRAPQEITKDPPYNELIIDCDVPNWTPFTAAPGSQLRHVVKQVQFISDEHSPDQRLATASFTLNWHAAVLGSNIQSYHFTQQDPGT